MFVRQRNSCVFSKRVILIAICFIVINLVQESSQFTFNFGGKNSEDEAPSISTGGKLAKKGRSVGKYKFRKIERVYTDEENLDDGDSEAVNSKQAKDDDDESKAQSAEADNSRMNEDEEATFEKARKAHKKLPTAKKVTKPRKTRKYTEDDDDDDEDDNQPAEAETSMFNAIYDMVFGAKEEVAVTEDEDKNSIITWIKWLAEKTARPEDEEPTSKENDNSASWKEYLNRWPFNSLFPMEKPKKSNRAAKKTTKEHIAHSEEAEPMSQEQFESLLHTLPAFVLSPSNVDDIDCRRQLQIFQRQLRGHKMWTLQMLDASGKIAAGVLHGNVNQFGDFDACTQIRTKVKITEEIPMSIRGKYCLAHIETQTHVKQLKVPLHLVHGRGLWNSHLGNPNHFVPRYTVAKWGICLPQLCSADVVQQMLTENFRPYNSTGIQFQVEVNDDTDCHVQKSFKFLKQLRTDGKFLSTICLILALCCLVLAGLVNENSTLIKDFLKRIIALIPKRPTTKVEDTEEKTTEESEEKPIDVEEKPVDEEQENVESETSKTTDVVETKTNTKPNILKQMALAIFESFSPRRTLAKLLSNEGVDVQFPLFHVLKIGSTFMLYICLKFIMVGHLPINNRDNLVRSLDQPLSIFFRTPLIYTDLLLLISGFFSAYQLSQEMQQKSYIHLLKRVAAKITRYMPTLYLVLAFQTWIQPLLGAGPLWNQLIGQNAHLCQQQMWRNLFSLQNAIDFEETCSPLTIHLAIELQLYLLAPLIVWLHFTDSDAGFFVYGAFHALSVAIRFARTNREHLSLILFHGMNVSKFYRTANLLFSSPITRATTYLLGIGAGVLYQSNEGVLALPEEWIKVGWTFSILGVIWCFWSPSEEMRSNFVYSSGDAASYAAWSPLILGLSVFWFIFMIPRADNGILGKIAASRPLLYLSRITFPMLLATYVTVLHGTATVRHSFNFKLTDLVNLNDIVNIVLYGSVIAFLIDVPMQNVRNILVEYLFSERPHVEIEDELPSGVETSEADETSEVITENITSDTPEPPETVWSSDPEEEEHKYLTRRRSSIAEVEVSTNKPDIDSNVKQKMEEEEEEDEEEEEEEEAEVVEEVKQKPPIEEPPKEELSYTRRRRQESEEKPEPKSTYSSRRFR